MNVLLDLQICTLICYLWVEQPQPYLKNASIRNIQAKCKELHGQMISKKRGEEKEKEGVE